MGFRGHSIVCGRGGLNSAKNNMLVPETDLIEATNITAEGSTWKRLPGTSKYNTTVITDAPEIAALHAFQLAAAQKIVAATSDGKIMTVDGDGIDVTLKTGLGTSKQSVLVEAYGASSTRKLFHFNGYDVVQTWDGAAGSTSNITAPPADWTGNNQPTFGVVHNNRLFGFGNANHPHRIYYSVATDHEDFAGAGSGTINVYPGEGLKLVAAVSYLGRLFLFKYPYGIYWLDDSDSSDSNWVLKKLTDSVGMVGPHGLCQITRDVLFMGSDGYVHFLSGVQEFGDTMSSVVLPSASGELLRERLVQSNLHLVTATFYEGKGLVFIGLPADASSYNNEGLILDVSRTKARIFWNSRDVIVSATIAKDSNNNLRPLVGDNAGFTWFLDDTTTVSKDGLPYVSSFRTPDKEIFLGRRVNLKVLEVVFQHAPTHNIDIAIIRDGVERESFRVEANSYGAEVLGGFILDTDTLGGSFITRWRKRLKGDCSTVSIRGSETGTDTDFSISEIRLYYNEGNDRL